MGVVPPFTLESHHSAAALGLSSAIYGLSLHWQTPRRDIDRHEPDMCNQGRGKLDLLIWPCLGVFAVPAQSTRRFAPTGAAVYAGTEVVRSRRNKKPALPFQRGLDDHRESAFVTW